MTPIENDQLRIDEKGDIWKVISFGSIAYLERERDGKGKNLSLKAVRKMPLAPRRIALVITPATATHCADGDNRCIGAGLEKCYVFAKRFESGTEDQPVRLPECIAAEIT